MHMDHDLSVEVGPVSLPLQHCCRYEKVGSEGYHSLFRWYSAFEAAQFPDPSGLRARLSAWTLGGPLLSPFLTPHSSSSDETSFGT